MGIGAPRRRLDSPAVRPGRSQPVPARWLELAVTSTAAQERVAAARLELPTAGWTTVDLLLGMEMRGGLTLRAGVRNLTDRYHVNHLNSRNPFTGRRIAELGRSVYGGAEVGF